MRWWWAGLAAFQVACKTAAPAPDPSPAAPPPPTRPVAKANAVRARATPFDVAACSTLSAPVPLTNETLRAWLEVERPRFEQCLAPTAARTRAQASARLTLTSASSGARVEVTPEGLAPGAVACLEASARALPLPSAGDLEARLTVVAPVGSAEPGASVVPDAEALRERVTSACACFGALGLNAPPQLVVHARPGLPLEVVTTTDVIAERLERCLEASVAAPDSPLEVTLDLPLLNGDSNQSSPDASSDVVAAQDVAMARRHLGRLELLLARRAALAQQVAALATSLKRKPTPALRQRRASLCAALFEVDDELPLEARTAADAATRAKLPRPATPALTLEPVQACAAVKPAEE
ncbi:MAG: hypothetical protein SFW67_03360 [Myxococcaceae bacterium]|nr:hypothetical protein [Myxococcaceae bacterium]